MEEIWKSIQRIDTVCLDNKKTAVPGGDLRLEDVAGDVLSYSQNEMKVRSIFLDSFLVSGFVKELIAIYQISVYLSSPPWSRILDRN